MVAIHHHSCTLCEATCGITVTTDGDRVADIRGDEHDPVSRGYICMPGVVSLPHGWGHGRPGVRLGVVSQHAGASINDVTDEQFVDQLTGTAALSGQQVTVHAVPPAAL